MTFDVKLSTVIEGPKVFLKSSTPGLAIPDKDASGIMDTITFTEDAAISSIKVSVDITHTYRGDLRVTLHAPSTDSVVLHERHQGGPDDNLKCTYDIATKPALMAFLDQSIKGDWTLQVQDLARWDEGVLNKWTLEIEGVGQNLVELEDAPGTKIPDSDPTGIAQKISTTETGIIKDIEVFIDITHTYIQDLQVTLLSPSGKSVILHNKTGGSADNIVKTYTTTTTPDLKTLLNEAIKGDWQLLVADHVGYDIGKLNRWHLKITRQMPEEASETLAEFA
jgi:subtilisin-like proprotein convertase family protein